jgi:hypothetical protein
VVISSGKNPYTEKIVDNIKIRVFDCNVLEENLIWHRDKLDRVIKVIESDSWYLQFDDQLPVELVVDSHYTIPSMMYHRIIKGNNSLKIEIKE